LARVLASFDTNTADGRVATVTNDFYRITGRQPQSFTEWLAQHRAPFAAL
jgi:NAD(P)H dehydrogenase (quinone)